jgi:hypothetical protein
VILGTGDFDGDGTSDILWRDTKTSQVGIWRMVGGNVAAFWYPGTETTDWQVQGIGDMDWDGKDDIVWRHMPYGDTHIWAMNGGTLRRDVAALTDGAENNWTIAGVNKELGQALR